MTTLERARLLLIFAACLPATLAHAQDSAPVTVPASIAAEGVPSVPQAIARALVRYQEVRSAGFQDWTDTDPTAMLVTTRFADTTQIHRVAMPGGARTQITFGPERVLGAEARPGRPEFSFSADEGGAENFQVFLADLNGGPPKRLTDGRSRNTSPRWSRSGTLLAFSSNARNGRDMDLYVVDPVESQPRPRLVLAVAGSWSVADWSPDGHSLAAVEYVSINESYVHLVDVASGSDRLLTPRREGVKPVAYQDVKFGPDGRSIYWTTDLDSEFLRLARLDIESGKSETLTQGIEWDVEGFDLSDDGALVALLANEDGISRLHVLDAKTGEERPAPEVPSGVMSGLAFRPGSHTVGFTLSAARSTADAYALDLDANTLTRWTASETTGFDVAAFPEPELIHFTTFDDREIPAFVYRPPAEKFPGPRPVLLNIHGGPEGQFRPGFLGRANYLLNELGVALVYPNVRGSSGYGKSYLLLDNGFQRDQSVQDIGALLDWISHRDEFDANRVGVTGGSYGGFMSLAVQTTYADRIKAGIDIVGISNFVTFLQNTQDYRRDLRRAEYGDERNPRMRAYLEHVSPLTNAAKLRNPLLVVQGKNDPRVPITEAEQIVAEARRVGTPVWYVVGLDEGHGFAKRTNQDYLQAVEVLFLRRFLIGEPGSASE